MPILTFLFGTSALIAGSMSIFIGTAFLPAFITTAFVLGFMMILLGAV